jgi:16S rRNA processing protein RimM
VLDVGRVVRPHGLKGQVVVDLWTNRVERLDPGTELTAGPRTLVVVSSSRLPEGGGRSRWMVAFSGLASREDAEQLRDVVLQAEALEVEGAMWVHRMVGSDLLDTSGCPVGRVEAVEANPASDLLILADGRAVPLTFVTLDAEGRLIVDGPPGLLDL